MDTIVMACVSQKGGTGKSTLIRATAKAAANDDMKVKIADLDVQQGTITEWHRIRLERKISPIGSVELFGSAKDAIDSVDSNTDLLLLDGPARASKQTLDIAQASHLVIQPAGPSLDDMKPAVLLFHELVKKKIPKNRLVMVLTRVGTEPEFKDAYDYISQAGYRVLNEYLFEKPAYRQAQNAGLTILETRFHHLNKAAENVINALIEILLKDNE
jgi:chromosome partitioning protein